MKNHFVFVVILLAGALVVYAQVTSTSTLSGTVLDTSGAVILGAAVTVKNEATGTLFRSLTRSSRSF